MKIKIHSQGLNKIHQLLQSNADRLSHLKPLWQIVGMYVQKQTIKERFDKEQSPDGSKWISLSPARVKQRLKKHKNGNMKILQDTGELRRSIQYEATDDYVRIGSNLVYARIHQFGGKHIPARPFLGVTQDERKHINNLFRQYLQHNVLGG